MIKQFLNKFRIFVYIHLFVLFIFVHQNYAVHYPLSKITEFGLGINVEGLYPLQKAAHTNKQIITACFEAVLDTPGRILAGIPSGIELTPDLHTEPRGGRMENNIAVYHEEQVNLFWLILLQAYLDNAHAYTHKNQHEKVVIMIHLFRGRSTDPHIELLKVIFNQFFNIPLSAMDDAGKGRERKLIIEIPARNIEVIIRGEYQLDRIEAYENIDILLGFGLVGGLDANLDSGSIIIPIDCVPLDVQNLHLKLSERFSIDNHLADILPTILQQYQNEEVIKFSDEMLYCPYKPRRKCNYFDLSMLKIGTIISTVNSFFVPSELKEVCGNDWEQLFVEIV